MDMDYIAPITNRGMFDFDGLRMGENRLGHPPKCKIKLSVFRRQVRVLRGYGIFERWFTVSGRRTR